MHKNNLADHLYQSLFLILWGITFVFQNVVEVDKQSNVAKGELMINDQDAMEVSSVFVMITQTKKMLSS